MNSSKSHWLPCRVVDSGILGALEEVVCDKVEDSFVSISLVKEFSGKDLGRLKCTHFPFYLTIR